MVRNSSSLYLIFAWSMTMTCRSSIVVVSARMIYICYTTGSRSAWVQSFDDDRLYYYFRFIAIDLPSAWNRILDRSWIEVRSFVVRRSDHANPMQYYYISLDLTFWLNFLHYCDIHEEQQPGYSRKTSFSQYYHILLRPFFVRFEPTIYISISRCILLEKLKKNLSIWK